MEEELQLLEYTRKSMARILAKMPLEAWDRVGVHNERGPMTVEKMLSVITNHISHHLQFIEEKRKALGV